MNWLDLLLLAVIVLGAIGGYRDGFLLGLLTLLGILIGIIAGFKLMGEALILLSDRIDVDEKFLPYIAFTVVFLIVLLAVTLIGKAIKASIDQTLLGRVDQAAGALLGTFKMVLILSVGLWLISSLSIELPEHAVAGSTLIPIVREVAPVVYEWVGEVIPAFGDIF